MPAAHRLSLLYCAALLSPLGAATAATPPADFMPPPGLYRIEMDTNIATTLAGITGVHRIQTDGSTGAESSSGKVSGGAWTQGITMPGNGPVTSCVKSVKGATSTAGLSGAGCISKGGALEAGAWVIRQQCGTQKVEVSIRKINSAVWEYKTVAIQPNVGSAASAKSTAEAVLAQMIWARDHAPKEEDRKKYAALVAEYEAMEDDAPEPGGSPAGSQPAGALHRNTVSVQKWTRIADQCVGLKK